MKDEAVGLRINPYELLVQNPDSTFFLQAGGDMPEFGISEGNYIVVDMQAPAHSECGLFQDCEKPDQKEAQPTLRRAG